MCRKLLSVLLCLSLLSVPLFSEGTLPVNTDNQRQTIQQLLQSMKLDLRLLELSIATYKTKINELQIIIAESQSDLTKQKQLLTESMSKLIQMEIQYNELSTTFHDLNRQYQSCLKQNSVLKKLCIGLGVGLAGSVLIIAVR